mmetsp:Transcript_19471/g.29989  ORF Transcript_19471/g.29989 Transcript_19471/m.29989 type:complete len:137 (-) Transcript_19471:170-580(-)
MTSSPIFFVIVGKNEPLYEAEFNKLYTADNVLRQNYFVLHSALDLVEKAAWTNTAMNLRVVDKVNHQSISAFVTAGGIKFLVLHSGKSEELLKNFFADVYELYVKLTMNPFYKYDSPIVSKAFDKRVRAVARRYLS